MVSYDIMIVVIMVYKILMSILKRFTTKVKQLKYLNVDWNKSSQSEMTRFQL